jgi:hypothetical protein
MDLLYKRFSSLWSKTDNDIQEERVDLMLLKAGGIVTELKAMRILPGKTTLTRS